MRPSASVAGVLCALALAGCTNAPLASQQVTRVRVLAIRAEPANVFPGSPLTLSALVVSPKQDDPDIETTWYLCQYASLDECAQADDMQVLGHGTSVSLTVPIAAAPGDPFVVWFDAKKGGEVERALKSVQVLPIGTTPNRNPDIDQVLWGTTWPPSIRQPDRLTVGKNGTLEVHVRAKPVPAEIYFDSSENADEDLRIETWTTNGFLIDRSGSGASGELYYQAPDQTGTFGAWIVLNDGRGGVDWRGNWIKVEGGSK